MPPAGPIRVAIDAVALLDTRTGVGRFLEETVWRLATHGDLDLVAFGQWPRARGRLRRALPARVRVVPLPMVGRPLRACWRRVPVPPIECWTGRVDVVHGPNFLVPPALAAATVVTVHDLTVLRYPQYCTDDTLQFPALLRRSIDRGAWVHTVSEHVRHEVIEMLGAPAERVVTVHNGVVALPEAAAGAGRALAGADRYVLALGTVEPRKDLPRLVDAFDALAGENPDLHLVIAGPDGWGSTALARRLDASPHRRRIVRLGWVDEDQRVALLREAAVLAYPSRYEGFGLPPLEAMSAGTPVVTTATGGITEVVGDAALTVPPGDTDALAGALDRVLHDEATAARLAAAGPDRAATFSWDATAAGLAALYRRVAGRGA